MKLAVVLFFASLAVVLGKELTGDDFHGHHEFSIDLIGEIGKGQKKNIAFSVSAIDSILALASLGTKGTASSQIRRALRLPTTEEKIKKKYAEIHDSIVKIGKMNITSANRIYVADNIQVEPEFMKVAKEVFQTDIVHIDFKDSEKARNEINNWVHDQVHEKIKDIIKKDHLSPDCQMALVNAHHLIGHWKNPFPKELTKKMDFHVTKTETVSVDMMQLTANLEIFRSDEHKATIVLVPMLSEGANSVFCILLPDEIDNLEELDKVMSEIILDQRYHEYKKENVKLFMPKFRIDSSINMIEPLKRMGIKDVFETPDFSIMTKTPIKPCAVSQKTVFEINEDGTEGVPAASHVAEQTGPHTREIHVDRPFYFGIQLNTDELVIVGGQVLNPLK